MSLLETVNNRTGARRYFVNGRRVSRGAFEAAKRRRLDSFLTLIGTNLTRHYCEVN